MQVGMSPVVSLAPSPLEYFNRLQIMSGNIHPLNIASTPGEGASDGGARFLLSRFILVGMLLGSLLSGCQNAVERGQSATLDSIDLQQMTDDMAMKIAGDPEVLAAFKEGGPLTVVVQPVENRLTGEVIPRGTAQAFTVRVRTLLAKSSREKFQWIMNRDAFYDLRIRELEGVDMGPSPEAVNPKFALTATFSNLVSVDPNRRASYYLCTFQLTNLQDRSVLWLDRYEVKKMAVKGFLD